MNNPGRKEGNKVTEKIEKGEREPKYPRSAFFYFCREKINENKEMKLSMNELGKMYINLPESDKRKYIKLSEESRKIYEEEMDLYRKKQAEIAAISMNIRNRIKMLIIMMLLKKNINYLSYFS